MLPGRAGVRGAGVQAEDHQEGGQEPLPQRVHPLQDTVIQIRVNIHHQVPIQKVLISNY